MASRRAIVLIGAMTLIPLVVGAVMDRGWPIHSLARWLVWLAGVLVIAGGAALTEWYLERRRAGADDDVVGSPEHAA